jgi:hypothetical protein
VKEYFNDLDTHQLDFSWAGDKDGKNIDMAFGKDADARKDWMRKFKVTRYYFKALSLAWNLFGFYTKGNHIH